MARQRNNAARPAVPVIDGPVRTCIGCRKRAAKRELLRVTAGSDPRTGQPVFRPDPDGTAPGRGAHLHPRPECYELAVRRKAFARALRVGAGPSSAPVGEYVTATSHTVNPTD